MQDARLPNGRLSLSTFSPVMRSGPQASMPADIASWSAGKLAPSQVQTQTTWFTNVRLFRAAWPAFVAAFGVLVRRGE
jgi:hypothetical protein